MDYTCPMHPEVHSNKPGLCPKCHMRLVLASGARMHKDAAGKETKYSRLFIIVGLIALATIVIAVKDVQQGTFVWKDVMINFMAGFFLVFSGFKLMNIKGFAEGYSMYDLLAKRIFQYGYVYPFIELAFGLAFLTSFHINTIAVIEIIVMAFSGLGVVKSMMRREKIQCACLGTIINVPLGTVTLVEDFGMALMGIALLIL